jgi:hypothetical protein
MKTITPVIRRHLRFPLLGLLLAHSLFQSPIQPPTNPPTHSSVSVHPLASCPASYPLSIHSLTNPSIHLPTYLSIPTHTRVFICPSIHPSIHPYPSTYPHIHPSTQSPSYLLTQPSIPPPIYPFTHSSSQSFLLVYFVKSLKGTWRSLGKGGDKISVMHLFMYHQMRFKCRPEHVRAADHRGEPQKDLLLGELGVEGSVVKLTDYLKL